MRGMMSRERGRGAGWLAGESRENSTVISCNDDDGRRNSKLQNPSSKEAPSFKLQASIPAEFFPMLLELGVWDLKLLEKKSGARNKFRAP
jgi:hypothetical protein